MIFTKLRSTYFHEVDSAAGFMDFNTPEVGQGPRRPSSARPSKVGYTFNWFYADAEHIAYFNSGANPVRAAGVDHDFPVAAKFEWRGWNPDTWQARFTPLRAAPAGGRPGLPRQLEQQAGQGLPLRRRQRLLLDLPLACCSRTASRRGSRARSKLTLPKLIDAMEVAGTGDLRAYVDLPLALRVIGKPRGPGAARTRSPSCARGRRTAACGATQNHDGVYEHTDAIRIMDAWWPLWVKAQFEPALGAKAFKALTETVAIDNPPNNHGDHLGSAYQGSWYGYVSKDLRQTLGDPVEGRYSRAYCGTAERGAATALRASLKAAAEGPGEPRLRRRRGVREGAEARPQWCFDAVRQRPTGGASQPLIHWINRPTYQQADEIPRRLPR